MIIELILLFLLMIIQVIIPPIPAELIVIAAGLKYGIFVTTIVAGSGLFVGSIIVYYLGNYLRKFGKKYFEQEKVKIVTSKLRKYGNWLLLVRILPYNPSDIISYTAGVLKFEIKSYIIITFLVTFSRVFLLALLGSFLIGIKSLLMVLSLLLVSGILAFVLVYRNKI